MTHMVGDAGHVADHNAMDDLIAGKATPEDVAAQIDVALSGLVVGLTGPPGPAGQDGAPGAAGTAMTDAELAAAVMTGAARAALDGRFAQINEPLAVRLTGAQTIGGAKDFTTAPTVGGAAMKLNGVAVTGTPTTGQVPTATGGTAATWQTPAAGGGGTVTVTGSGSGPNCYNVRTDGTATGNGTTDDTAAIVAAMGAANTAGLPVYLPKGTYLVTGITIANAGQEWILAENAVVKLKAATTSTGVFIISGTGVKFSGGNIDGNLTNESYMFCYGINVTGVNVVVQGVEIYNCMAGGVQLYSSSLGCLIQNNYCRNNGTSANAANGVLVATSSRHRIIGNRCENNGTAGNEALYDGNGIYLTGTNVGHNLVANNQCSYNARRGIKVQQGGNNVVGNTCVLNSCGVGVTDSINPTDTPTVISGNTIKDSTLQGMQIDRCAFLTISGNQIVDSGSHGVGVSFSSNYVTFTGNSVVRSGGDGVHISGSLGAVVGWIIANNMLYDNAWGVALDATVSKVAVTGNMWVANSAGTISVGGASGVVQTANMA